MERNENYFLFSYREAVFCLELIVNINADSVKVFHFLTGLNVPGRSRTQEKKSCVFVERRGINKVFYSKFVSFDFIVDKLLT